MPVNALWGMVACQLIQLGNATRFLPSDQLTTRAALSIGHLIYVSVSRIDLSWLSSLSCLKSRIVWSFVPRRDQPCLARIGVLLPGKLRRRTASTLIFFAEARCLSRDSVMTSLYRICVAAVDNGGRVRVGRRRKAVHLSNCKNKQSVIKCYTTSIQHQHHSYCPSCTPLQHFCKCFTLIFA